ncbi:MFS transporter [Sporolactobacillus sp. CQH2019]|uniref:MFS transporter n=1 Tax=Sporolactobacillus sp. CQH2019 TaxID=3023512 RepID=UPI00236816EE|nr:MFS transporter [Sporolactobacillus sp. CQH2019]MDD9149080.1 MFS transporter [Sporolactobacillus sp. CQH2019]
MVKFQKIRVLCITVMMFMISQGIIDALIVVSISVVLHGNQSVLGYAEASQGAGMVITGLMMGWVKRYISYENMFAWGLLGVGLSFMIGFNADRLFILLPALLITGLFTTMQMVGYRTLLQVETPPETRGRIFASVTSLMSMSAILASFVSGALAQVLPIHFFFNLASLALISAGTFASVMFLKLKGQDSPVRKV